jgi:hypothetical protein
VSTPDQLQGQFNIPGRGTFNIIPDSTTAERAEQSPRTPPEGLRRRHNLSGSSSESENSTRSADAGNSSTEQPPAEAVYDEGDLNEPELTTKIRFLDESEILCRFRPSQSLGDFKSNCFFQNSRQLNSFRKEYRRLDGTQTSLPHFRRNAAQR